MRAPWKTASLIAIPIAYCLAFAAFTTDALYQGFDDLTVAGVNIVFTAVAVGSWYKIGMSATSRQGRGAQRLTFASGAWVGVAVALLVTYAFVHMFYGLSGPLTN